MTLLYKIPLKNFLLQQAKRMQELAVLFPFFAQALGKGFRRTEKGEVDWEILDTFFSSGEDQVLQQKLILTQEREEQKTKGILKALEEARAAHFIYHRRLSFEMTDRLLKKRLEHFLEVDAKGQVRAVKLTVAELEDRLQKGILTIQGVEKRKEKRGLVFIAAQGTSSQKLFHRVLLECDPRYCFRIEGGQAQDCERFILLCIANQLTWRCETFACPHPHILQQAIDRLPAQHKASPLQLYQSLGAIPDIQSYYLNHCLVLDLNRLEEVVVPLKGDDFQNFMKQFQHPSLLKAEWIRGKQKTPRSSERFPPPRESHREIRTEIDRLFPPAPSSFELR